MRSSPTEGHLRELSNWKRKVDGGILGNIRRRRHDHQYTHRFDGIFIGERRADCCSAQPRNYYQPDFTSQFNRASRDCSDQSVIRVIVHGGPTPVHITADGQIEGFLPNTCGVYHSKSFVHRKAREAEEGERIMIFFARKLFGAKMFG